MLGTAVSIRYFDHELDRLMKNEFCQTCRYHKLPICYFECKMLLTMANEFPVFDLVQTNMLLFLDFQINHYNGQKV